MRETQASTSTCRGLSQRMAETTRLRNGPRVALGMHLPVVRGLALHPAQRVDSMAGEDLLDLHRILRIEQLVRDVDIEVDMEDQDLIASRSVGEPN